MYIVTGGAGFIGSVVAAFLNEKYPEERVVVCDWLGVDDPRWKNLNRRQLSSIIPPEDIHKLLTECGEDVKAIIHMGAISDTAETDINALNKWNLRSTLELFNWCEMNGVPFIYASSAATYGNGENGFEDSEELAYLNKLWPLNAYGFSKNMADKAILQTQYKPQQWVGLKFFNVYGPNEYHKGSMASVVSHAFKQIKETGQVKLFKSHHPDYEDGGQLRDFIYVKDVAQIILWLLEHRNVSGLFNVGTGQARSFKDLAQATFSALNLKADINYIDTPEKYRKHYQYFTQADMAKFNRAYAMHEEKAFAFTSLEDGVRDYVQNYLDKENPYL